MLLVSPEEEEEEEEEEDEDEGNSGAEVKEIDIIAGERGRLGVCLSSLSLFARRSRQFLKVPLAARKRSGEGVGLCLRDLRFGLPHARALLFTCVCLCTRTLPVYKAVHTHTPGTCCESCDSCQGTHTQTITTYAHTMNDTQ